jgi:hypothetical protein
VLALSRAVAAVGAARYVGPARGAAIGGAVPAGAGVQWLGPTGAVLALAGLVPGLLSRTGRPTSAATVRAAGARSGVERVGAEPVGAEPVSDPMP